MAAIRHDDTAYRRGVVFGFTVAEVVLLLVFCLLLLFVPLLLGENTKSPKPPAGPPPYVELPGRAPGAVEGGPELGEQAPATDAPRERALLLRPKRRPSLTIHPWAIPPRRTIRLPRPLRCPRGGSGSLPMEQTKIRHRTKTTSRGAPVSRRPQPTLRSTHCPLHPYATGSASRPQSVRQWRLTRS